MDRTLATIIGAMTSLAAAVPAQAATHAPITLEDAMAAHSYADLLRPIPNALALLQASDAARAEEGPALVQEVQYYYHHHHHHHHSQYYQPYGYRPPFYPPAYYPQPYYVRPRYHHHHHHHHHHQQYRGERY